MRDDLNMVLNTIRLNRHGIPSEKNCSLAALCGLDTEGALIAARYNLEKNPSALSDRATSVLLWKTGNAADVVLYDEWVRAFCDYENWRQTFNQRHRISTTDVGLRILTQVLESDDFYCLETLERKCFDLIPFGVNYNPREAVLVSQNGVLRLFDKRIYEDDEGRVQYVRLHPSAYPVGESYILSVLTKIIERGAIIPRWFDEV